MKNVPNKTCSHCLSPFFSFNSGAKFCSRGCYFKGLQKIPKINDLANCKKWFWGKVDICGESECWPWMGTNSSKGVSYGRVTRFHEDGSFEYAHRISYFLFNGRFANGLTRHKCDNPICVNPNHLLEGTHKDNSRDASERKRLGNGKFSEEQILYIRNSEERSVDLAKKFDCHDATICRIRKREIYKKY